VYLFGLNPGMDEPEEFLKRLVGIVKNRLTSHQGIASLSALAAATAQRLGTIQTGLEWLDEHGYITMISIDKDEAKIETGNGRKKEEVKNSSDRLNAWLAESAAFRRYYLSANKDRLLLLDEEPK